MSVYPVYSLEVYDYVQGDWIDVASEPPGNEPHAYDRLRAVYERLVETAKEGSPRQAPIGYRIMVRGSTVVDVWKNLALTAREDRERRLAAFEQEVRDSLLASGFDATVDLLRSRGWHSSDARERIHQIQAKI